MTQFHTTISSTICIIMVEMLSVVTWVTFLHVSFVHIYPPLTSLAPSSVPSRPVSIFFGVLIVFIDRFGAVVFGVHLVPLQRSQQSGPQSFPGHFPFVYRIVLVHLRWRRSDYHLYGEAVQRYTSSLYQLLC